ncbi:MAG: FAD-dependent oxidoreductase [Anaerolineae bacterium]|nr:FAD-dependent oxidoreductase [Anaerolineae bacterium]
MSEENSVLVIGAGAAGLACARRLVEAGRTVRVLEARNRTGGRIQTDTSLTGYPLELGAEFIHGEQAATHGLVRQAGLSVIAVDRLRVGLRWGVPALPLEALTAETREKIVRLRAAYARLEARPENAPDQSLADYLMAQGFDAEALGMADVLLAQTCCARLDSLSCADLAREMRADHAGPLEYRITEGYGALLDWLASGLPISVGAAVQRLTWGAAGVVAETSAGRFEAKRTVITLPAAVLAAGTVEFDPPLLASKRDALRGFRTEPATKLLYVFAERRWDADLTFMAHEGSAARWWTPNYRRSGPPVLAAYITADRARRVDALDEAEALALGLREAAELLGDATLSEHVKLAKRVSWASDPQARGGYAHVLPGMAGARPALAAPVEDVLFFAGEATAWDSNPQTVHGAIESGWRAAEEIRAVC